MSRLRDWTKQYCECYAKIPPTGSTSWEIIGYKQWGESIHPMEIIILVWFGLSNCFYVLVNASLRVLYGYYCRELPRGQ